MKKNSFIKILLMSGLGALTLSSCTSNQSDPIDVIKDHYGDKQFKISFSSEGLEKPLSDIIYSANNIPKLPTPSKVGFRFAGWYFDTQYTKPYETDYLYTKMCDVTLYAKWEKEEFINNGIYEIEYSAKILPNTIVKGSLADEYGYLEFPKDIISDETYIEKNNNGVFLRIQYDMRYHCPTLDDDGNPGILTYTVSDTAGRVSSTESIIDRTGTIQTIYYDLANLNIADPIMLNVEFYNWNANLKNEEDRSKTKVGYTVEFDITRFIGYTTSFVDANDHLEDGYYLVKTHYANFNKAATMLDMFNPVYSYLIASGGHYKLVKPMNAYNSDIIGDLKDQDYIHVKTGFARDIAYFKFDQKIVATDDMVEEDNYGKTDWISFFNAEYFSGLTYEFHADTGKYYYVFDLGDKANVDLFLVGASTGAMTEMFNMGPTYKRLVIDYSSMVKLSDIDYKPLEGDTYSTYQTEAYYFSSDLASLKNNTIYNAEMDYDFANRLINTFYSSTSGNNVSALHSTRMTITPTSKTNEDTILNQKGKVFTFMATYDCYCYDVKSGYPLYGDYIEWQTFNSFSQRTTKRLELGYKASKNEKINLYTLFKDKIYPSIDEGNLTYEAYALKANGEADFNKPIDLSVSNNVFTYDKDMALYLKGSISGEVKSGLIIVRAKEDPTIVINDTYEHENGEIEEITWKYNSSRKVYESSKTYYKGDEAHIPTIFYDSYGKSYNSHNAYNSESDTYHMNQEDFSIYSLSNGIYTKQSYNYEDWNASTFQMASDVSIVYYRMVDRYGYVTYLAFEYKGEEKGKYNVILNGESVCSGTLYYYYDSTRQNLNVKDTEALELIDVDAVYDLKYKLELGYQTFDLALVKYNVYTREASYEGVDKEELKAILAKTSYALVDFTYQSNADTYTKCYVYNLRVNGKPFSKYEVLQAEAWFTNTKYQLSQSIIMDLDGINLSTSSISFQKYVGTVLRNTDLSELNSEGYTYTFLKAGKYRLIYKFAFYQDENELYPIKDYNIGYAYENKYRYITVSKDIDVYAIDEEINVTYITDAKHPFRSDLAGVTINADGTQAYKTTFKQTENSYAINSTYFESSKDHLWKWSYLTKGGSYSDYASPDGSLGALGAKRNTTNPILYARWDEGIKVRAYYNIDGTDREIATKTYYKSGTTYTLVLADFVFTVPIGYTFTGWECDKPIFYTGAGENKKYFYQTDALYDTSFEITESCEIKAILKGPLTVKYQKYENGTYIDLSIAYSTVVEGSTLGNTLTSTQLRALKRQEQNEGFNHWAILVNGTLKTIDLENEAIIKDYLENGFVTIVAVYGE